MNISVRKQLLVSSTYLSSTIFLELHYLQGVLSEKKNHFYLGEILGVCDHLNILETQNVKKNVEFIF